MFHRDRFELEYLDLYKMGMGTTIWSPLMSGILTGKYNDTIPEGTRFDLEEMDWLRKFVFAEGRIDKVRALTALAEEAGMSMTHMALAWCMKNPNVSTVILGASKLSQLEDNLKSLDALPKMTSDLMEKIELILQNKPNRTWF